MLLESSDSVLSFMMIEVSCFSVFFSKSFLLTLVHSLSHVLYGSWTQLLVSRKFCSTLSLQCLLDFLCFFPLTSSYWVWILSIHFFLQCINNTVASYQHSLPKVCSVSFLIIRHRNFGLQSSYATELFLEAWSIHERTETNLHVLSAYSPEYAIILCAIVFRF